MANSIPRNAIYSYPKSGRSGVLVALAISSKKRATASLLRDYATGVEPVPQAGDFVVFVDGGGRPRCIWRTTGVIVKPFIDVDDAFAWDEGERERTRDWWLLDRSGNGFSLLAFSFSDCPTSFPSSPPQSIPCCEGNCSRSSSLLFPICRVFAHPCGRSPAEPPQPLSVDDVILRRFVII